MRYEDSSRTAFHGIILPRTTTGADLAAESDLCCECRNETYWFSQYGLRAHVPSFAFRCNGKLRRGIHGIRGTQVRLVLSFGMMTSRMHFGGSRAKINYCIQLHRGRPCGVLLAVV
jgi:hypothetical protein